MTTRAAEMARIIKEEWDAEKESAEDFAMRRFKNDLFTNLDLAVKILSELDRADNMATDWFESRK